MAGTTRTVRNISAGAVAAIAAWSSYSHMVHVALKFGERPEVASVLPCSVDGMLLVASMVMIDDKRRSHRVRPIARVAFAAGVLASVAANIAAAHPNVGARIVAAWPAVALLLVVEMLARPPVPAAAEVPPVPTAAEPRPVTAAQIPPPAASAPLAAVAPVVVPARPDDVPPVLAQRRRESGDAPAAEPTRADRGRRVEPPPRTAGRRRPAAATRQLARQIIAAEPQLSRAEVAARLGVSTRRLREVLAVPA